MKHPAYPGFPQVADKMFVGWIQSADEKCTAQIDSAPPNGINMEKMTKEALFSLYLAGTILTEASVLWIFTRLVFKVESETIPTALLVFAGFVSLGTLPYVWYVLPPLFDNHIAFILVAEPLVLMPVRNFEHRLFLLLWTDQKISIPPSFMS